MVTGGDSGNQREIWLQKSDVVTACGCGNRFGMWKPWKEEEMVVLFSYCGDLHLLRGTLVTAS